LEYINEDNFLKKNINNYKNMEEIIKHFKYWSDGFIVNSNWTYQSIESPKGEFGVTLVSDGTNKPYRCKVRSPSYQNLQALPQMSKGHFLADLVTLIGTIDIVFGEIDR
jgi:NADH:ubiquinone oxidoreductase subunit D